MLAGINLLACNRPLTDPQKIIDKAIGVAGGEKYLHTTIEFDFRDRHYIAQRENGQFSYERVFEDSIGTIHDYLTNSGFRRETNGAPTVVSDIMKERYSSSVNSVIYFALLPYGLNDEAVVKKFVRETTIDSVNYYVVGITFKEQGGGEDYQDEFMYWINKNDFTIGYMAYSYDESDGVGLRFRSAFNARKINGILFLDYINYKPKGSVPFSSLEELYKSGELEELSKIELKKIQVK